MNVIRHPTIIVGSPNKGPPPAYYTHSPTKLNKDPPCANLRLWLLVWGIMRLLLSVVWNIGLMAMVYWDYYYNVELRSSKLMEFIFFGVIPIIVQLVDLGMIITFIVAGVTKKVHLYLVYFWYCIISLMVYIIVLIVTLMTQLPVMSMYFSAHIDGILGCCSTNRLLVFSAYFTIGLEITMIYLIKRLVDTHT